MAWMNQERKAQIKAALDKVVPKGWKYTLSVDNHSTIVMTVLKSPFDVFKEASRVQKVKFSHYPNYDEHAYDNKGHLTVNQYYPENLFDDHLSLIQSFLDALNLRGEKGANYNNSDIQTDYFDVGWYVTLQFGRWDKPYLLDEGYAFKVKKALPQLFDIPTDAKIEFLDQEPNSMFYEMDFTGLPPKFNVLTTEEYEAVKAKVKTKLYSTDQGKAIAKGQVYWVKGKK